MIFNVLGSNSTSESPRHEDRKKQWLLQNTTDEIE